MIFDAIMNDDRAALLFDGCSPELIRKFEKFHEQNPGVYSLFLRFTKEAKAAGRPRFSGWMIANRIRWYTSIETKGEDCKISNDFIAVYVRLIVYLFPEFEGFFQLKRMGGNGLTEEEMEVNNPIPKGRGLEGKGLTAYKFQG